MCDDNDVKIVDVVQTDYFSLDFTGWVKFKQQKKKVAYVHMPPTGYCGWTALGVFLNHASLLPVVGSDNNMKEILSLDDYCCDYKGEKITCVNYALLYAHHHMSDMDRETKRKLQLVNSALVSRAHGGLHLEGWMNDNIISECIMHWLDNNGKKSEIYVFCMTVGGDGIVSQKCVMYYYDEEKKSPSLDLVCPSVMCGKFSAHPCFMFVFQGNPSGGHYDIIYNNLLIT